MSRDAASLAAALAAMGDVEPAPPPIPPCACQQRHGLQVSPDSAVEQGVFRLDHREVHRGQYYTEWRVTCRSCGQRYSVKDDLGYWKPLYYWTALDPV